MDELVAHYVQREGFRTLALQILEATDQDKINPGSIRRAVEEVSRIAQNGSWNLSVYQESHDSDLEVLTRGRVPIGIPAIDKALGGGLGPGEYGLVVAPYRGGKSAILVNFGAAAIQQGKRVLHISLEMSRALVQMRYDMRFGGVTTGDLMKMSRKKVRMIRSRVKGLGGSLSILDHSHLRLTPSLLESLIEQTGPYDIVILDYIKPMRSDRNLEGRFEIEDVTQELRRIANYYSVPLWCAAQTNREGVRQRGEFSGADIGEDLSQLQTGDVVLLARQTDADKKMNQLCLVLDKTRMSLDIDVDPVFVRMDYRTMTMSPNLEEEEEADASAAKTRRQARAWAKDQKEEAN